MAKKNFIKVLSPVGTAQYAWIARPDQGHEFSDGKYKVTLMMNPDEEGVSEAIARINTAVEDAAIAEWGKLPKVYRSPIKSGDDIADEKEGKEDLRGMFMLTTKSKFQPGMVDAERKELPEDVFVSSGDTIRVSAVLIPYTAGGMKGIAMQLRNVQLLAQRSGNDSGGGDEFDDVSGYSTEFSASSIPATSQEEPQSGSSNEEEPDDF